MKLREGQTLLEFAVSVTMISIVLISAGWLLKSQWDRGKCAFLVFEKVHSRLTKANEINTRVNVRIFEDARSVRGIGHCGDSREEVSLPRLEPISWANPQNSK